MEQVSKIMLLDDDKGIHTLIKRIIEESAYDFCSAFDSIQGFEVLKEEKPDLLLLDVMLPGMNGFDFCRKMRAEGRRIPVIFLSAKGDIVDKEIGFQAGGDDYVIKPFNPEELLIRIKALLRRHQDDLSYSKSVCLGGSLVAGDLEINFRDYEVLLRGEKVGLTAKEFEILALLASHPGQVYTREQIYKHIWGDENFFDGNSVTVFVRKIREKIEDNPSKPRYLTTVWRVGYKFVI